jgi:hypothetical protein
MERAKRAALQKKDSLLLVNSHVTFYEHVYTYAFNKQLFTLSLILCLMMSVSF